MSWIGRSAVYLATFAVHLAPRFVSHRTSGLGRRLRARGAGEHRGKAKSALLSRLEKQSQTVKRIVSSSYFLRALVSGQASPIRPRAALSSLAILLLILVLVLVAFLALLALLILGVLVRFLRAERSALDRTQYESSAVAAEGDQSTHGPLGSDILHLLLVRYALVLRIPGVLVHLLLHELRLKGKERRTVRRD